MALNINQFGQTTVQGQIDLQFNSSVVSAAVSDSQGTALVAGQAVKLENSAGGVPKVLALTSNTDTAFGIVLRNLKDKTFPAKALVEIGLNDTVVYLTGNTTSPVIARGAAVEFDYVTNTVLAWAGINPIIGYAYDSFAAAGDLGRVLLQLPAFANNGNSQRTVNVTATLAQINAGLVIIPGAAGKRITVTSFVERVVGAFATGTSVNLQSDATAVIVEASAEAGLTNGAVLTSAPTANVTLGAGFATPLPVTEGLKVVNIGAAQTGGTSIQFTVTYTQG